MEKDVGLTATSMQTSAECIPVGSGAQAESPAHGFPIGTAKLVASSGQGASLADLTSFGP